MVIHPAPIPVDEPPFYDQGIDGDVVLRNVEARAALGFLQRLHRQGVEERVVLDDLISNITRQLNGARYARSSS